MGCSAMAVCEYIVNTYPYIMPSYQPGVGCSINEFYAEKHGYIVAGHCETGNGEFARFCRNILGLDANAVLAGSHYSTNPDHVWTEIMYNNKRYVMDATPGNGYLE